MVHQLPLALRLSPNHEELQFLNPILEEAEQTEGIKKPSLTNIALMMGKPARTKTLPLAIIFMILLYLLPSDAVRPSRAVLVTRAEERPSGSRAELTDQVVGEEMLKEVFPHGRVDIEEITKNDYPGSGANNRHDPPNKP